MPKWVSCSAAITLNSTLLDETKRFLYENEKLESLSFERSERCEDDRSTLYFSFECEDNIAIPFGLSVLEGNAVSDFIQGLKCNRLVVYGEQKEDGIEEQILFDAPDHLIYQARFSFIKPA